MCKEFSKGRCFFVSEPCAIREISDVARVGSVANSPVLRLLKPWCKLSWGLSEHLFNKWEWFLAMVLLLIVNEAGVTGVDVLFCSDASFYGLSSSCKRNRNGRVNIILILWSGWCNAFRFIRAEQKQPFNCHSRKRETRNHQELRSKTFTLLLFLVPSFKI